MRALEFITGYVIYNSAYAYKFQLKTTQEWLVFNAPVNPPADSTAEIHIPDQIPHVCSPNFELVTQLQLETGSSQ